MSISRRGFLKLVGGAVAAAATGAQAARTASSAGPSQNGWGMLTDATLCIGCRKCEFACKDANGLPNQPIEDFEDASVFEHGRRTDANNVTVVNRYESKDPGTKPIYVKRQCMHCNEPACVSACPVAALRKMPEGPVVYNPNVCIGCRYCMVACPFSIPAYTYDDPYTPVVRKCTMCFDKIINKEGVPACAKICPVEAVTFGKRSELLALAREKLRNNPERYVDHIYGEYEVGGTCWLYIADRPFDEIGFRTDLGTIPYPELTKDFLSAVPLVLAIWPALLMGAYALTKRPAPSPCVDEAPHDISTPEGG